MSLSGSPQLPPLTPEEAAETHLPRIMGITAVFHILALAFFVVRMYTRFVLVKAPKLDDAFMILATFGAFACGMVMFLLQADKGLGRHRQTIDDDKYLKLRSYGWVYSVGCAVVSFSLLKISIALSLIRMSKARWFTWSLYALIAFITSYTIVALCSFFFHCSPMEGSYNVTIKAKCYSVELFVAFAIMNTAFNMFSDVICATLPIPIIWTLNMKLRTRIYLIIILSLGYVTVGMGVVKAYFQVGVKRDPDLQFEQNIQFYGFIQINLGIIVACAPTLRPLLGNALKLSGRDKYYNSYYGNRSGGTGTGASMSRRSRKNRTGQYPDENDLEMDEGALFDKTAGTMTTVHGGKTTVYDKNSERSGSEELILQDTEPKGILRTTQIHVQ